MEIDTHTAVFRLNDGPTQACTHPPYPPTLPTPPTTPTPTTLPTTYPPTSPMDTHPPNPADIRI